MKLVSRKPGEAAPARMGALAKLPVFLDLDGRRAVVAGGSAPAVWKAELLAAAGADVHIYAPEVSSEMSALLARGAANGRLTLHERPWSVDCIAPAAVALADIESEDEARAFACAARAAGVPFNVIDKPAFCQFQFGGIVNRSPVVVAISTDGAAPILGQAIRRRIETLLPATLATWGKLAKSIRSEVSACLPAGPARRRFWERLSEAAFTAAAPANGEASRLRDWIGEIAADATVRSGRVTLVGAGPGDGELLTLKAVRALQSADVILYDDLVSDDVLELARREAQRMMVGKRGGRDSCAQEDINELMVKLARQGKHVVRLKCGDPMIFGRAGEEIERLRQDGIACAVVPGITAASAMAAALGVSLTHRDHAQSLRFVTGHARSGELPADLDWAGLTCPRTTLIVYMGGRTAAALARRLMDHGLDATTPVAAMSSVSTPQAARWCATLADLADGGLPATMANPVLIGIGAALRTRTPEPDHLPAVQVDHATRPGARAASA
jgi:uroporphyrin-III C-methyltransferase/precorrin-2 dehydrogenase/sirohydrochlorin ferrochelatase